MWLRKTSKSFSSSGLTTDNRILELPNTKQRTEHYKASLENDGNFYISGRITEDREMSTEHGTWLNLHLIIAATVKLSIIIIGSSSFSNLKFFFLFIIITRAQSV